MSRSKKKVITLVMIVILVLFSILSIIIGVDDFSLIDLFKGSSKDYKLFINSRLPRLLAIIITGALLSIGGLIMQVIAKNKFVSPSTAGTFAWARLGILIVMFFFTNSHSLIKILVAFLVSLLGSLVFILFLKKTKFQNTIMVPLIGIMIGNVVSSITTYFAYQFDVIQNISSWLMGSFTLITKGNYELLYIGIPFLVITYLYASKFTVAALGEDVAKGLGLNYQVVVNVGLIIVSAISSIVVVTVGSIPFVGLIIPNLISIYFGDNIKKSLFINALSGAILLLITDIISRVILFPYEISISITLSVVGSIIFLILIFRKDKVKI